MHSLEYGQGSGEQTHPVHQKQNIQSRADHFSSGVQVWFTLSASTQMIGFMRLESQSPDQKTKQSSARWITESLCLLCVFTDLTALKASFLEANIPLK